MGKRFRDLPNIVWVLGGDFIPDKADQWTAGEVADGIRDEDPIHPMSAHGTRGKQVVAGLGDPTWLAVNTTYIDAGTLIESTRTAYERRPIINDVPLPNRGFHSLRTPGDNGTRTNDRVLVLEVR